MEASELSWQSDLEASVRPIWWLSGLELLRIGDRVWFARFTGALGVQSIWSFFFFRSIIKSNLELCSCTRPIAHHAPTALTDVANYEPHLGPFRTTNWAVGFTSLSTTTRLSATNYLLINAGESTDQRQIEKAPDCNRTRPKISTLTWLSVSLKMSIPSTSETLPTLSTRASQ